MSIKHLPGRSLEEVRSNVLAMPSSSEKINLARQYNVELPEEEISKAIVKDSQIENFINVFYSDKPTAQFTFLEERDRIANFSESPVQKSTLKTYSKEVTPKEHIFKTGTLSNMYNSFILNDASRIIYRNCFRKIDELATKSYRNTFTRKDKMLAILYRLLKKVLKKEYVKRIEVKNISDLLDIVKREAHLLSLKNMRNSECFVICNYKNAMLLGYDDLVAGHTYDQVTQFCRYGNLKVYRDPFINIKDNTFIIGMKTKGIEAGLHAVFFGKGTEITQLSGMCGNALVPDNIDKTELCLKMKYDIVDAGTHPEYKYTKIIVNYTHKFYDNCF